MKKKGKSQIPDFSRKQKGAPVPGASAARGEQVAPQKVRVIKPQGAVKLGRRGQ